MSLEYLVTWMMVFMRTLGVVLLLPEFAGRVPPVMIRIGLTAFIATLIVGLVPPSTVPPNLASLGLAGGEEIVLGLLLGFVGRLAFFGVEMAGRITSSEVGFSAAPGFGAPSVASEPLAGFMSTFAVVLFFLFGGHLAAVGALARSFAFVHPGNPGLSSAADVELVRLTGWVIELGLRIASPFLAFNFLVTLAFAVVGRAIPRMQVFIISASLRTIGGMALLAGSGALIGHHLYVEFQAIPSRILEMVALR